MNDRLKIAITLPYLFTVRDFLFTPVWDEMVRRSEAQFYLLNNDIRVTKLVTERGSNNVSAPLLRNNAVAGLRTRVFRLFDDRYLYDSLSYRFAAINGLSHLQIYRRKSRAERKRQQVFFIYRKGEKVGLPFAKNRTLFRLLYMMRHGALNPLGRGEMTFLRDINPDLFVFGRLQLPATAYWARALEKQSIPMVGILSSWDHPTIQGPLTRGMTGYVVASRCMVEELVGLHGIDRDRICQVGKVQMDRYRDPATFLPREEFLARLGIPPGNRLVTFGTNTTGLKEHEVSIARQLADSFVEGRYGDATLLLRTHPQDANRERDFLSLEKHPQIVCQSAASFGDQRADSLGNGDEDQVFLANLMKNSDVVIQSRGSLALDAIAFDTPVISLAFDGDLARSPNDSFVLEYEYEHYKPLVTARGTWMVGSYETLDRAIRDYLADPSIHAEGRKIIREEHIEPLDGHASRRLIDHLVTSARKAREGTLPIGDWGHRGLGDITWASRQICRVADYVQ